MAHDFVLLQQLWGTNAPCKVHVVFRNEAVNLLGEERHYSAYHMAFKNLAFSYFLKRRIGRRSRRVFENNAPWIFQVSAHLESRGAWCLCSRLYSQECLYSKQLWNMGIVFTSGAKVVIGNVIGKCLPPGQKAGFPFITKDSGFCSVGLLSSTIAHHRCRYHLACLALPSRNRCLGNWNKCWYSVCYCDCELKTVLCLWSRHLKSSATICESVTD